MKSLLLLFLRRKSNLILTYKDKFIPGGIGISPIALFIIEACAWSNFDLAS
jgi:hypothetical protein